MLYTTLAMCQLILLQPNTCCTYKCYTTCEGFFNIMAGIHKLSLSMVDLPAVLSNRFICSIQQLHAVSI